MNVSLWRIIDQFGRVVDTAQILNLGATGLEEVLQNVLVICSSRVGDQVADRKFGTRWNFIDRPQNIAPIMILQEVLVAINQYEPRASFSGIRFFRDPSNLAAIVVEITIRIDPAQLSITQSALASIGATAATA
jgi:Bacteriophage baseplate protein W